MSSANRSAPQDMAVASVGDVQFMPDYNWFRRRSYWLRY